MQVHVQVNVSFTIPGSPDPVKFQQWFPVEVPTPRPPEPPTDTAATSATPAPVAHPGLSVLVPGHVPRKLPVEISVNGKPRTVAACVAQVLAELARGSTRVRMRAETRDKMAEQAPEVLSLLARDHDRKVQGKLAWYSLAEAARGAFRVQ